MKFSAVLHFMFASALAESCSPNLRGCCYFDFSNPAGNHKLPVNCHCNGQWCNTNFGEATPGTVTVTCPNAGAPYEFSWRYQNGNTASGSLSGGAQVFTGSGQSSIVTAVTCEYD
ncbi:hypothetical protein CONLIGDRAFT_680893 [Coniochaeta ligniaria NRRL 30616]|uniref:Ig-like domain-containing protein n=1 Tax=Coniochaeta ligniaria NRRL 30616 TaxID=1408157 RepID=A0A1J7JJV1_9PEZI|nr:hypothetical protein CONLIGDRAFT_680893 [Coniochaeta ligniaria NRRL 30616]